MKLLDKIELISINKLIPYSNNPKEHPEEQINKIASSIKNYGFTVPIVIDEGKEIISGHGRYKAAKKLELDEVPCIIRDDLNLAEVKSFRITDNKVSESGWDLEALAMELEELEFEGFDLDLTGFGPDERKDIMLEIEGGNFTEEDDFDIDNVDMEEEAIINKGDLIELGDHRLLCGDSIKIEDVETLMAGQKANMLFTDPPYLMDFNGSVGTNGEKAYNAKHRKIKNDDLSKDERAEFLYNICTVIRMFCNGSWYVCFYRLGIDWLMNAINEAGMKWRNLIIWKKNHLNLSNSDYKSIYEPIILGWDDDYDPILYGWNLNHDFYGEKGETDVWEIELPSVWEIDRTKKNDLHPTMKPLKLIERAVKNSSLKKDIVLDLFGGSGSTLITCDQLNRICYMMELDEKYCDIIIQRYINYRLDNNLDINIKVNGEEVDYYQFVD